MWHKSLERKLSAPDRTIIDCRTTRFTTMRRNPVAGGHAPKIKRLLDVLGVTLPGKPGHQPVAQHKKAASASAVHSN